MQGHSYGGGPEEEDRRETGSKGEGAQRELAAPGKGRDRLLNQEKRRRGDLRVIERLENRRQIALEEIEREGGLVDPQ